LLVAQLAVRPKKFGLVIGQVRRNHNSDVDEHVTPAAAPQTRHTFLAQAEYGLRLRPCRDVDRLRVRVDHRDVNCRTEDCLADPDLDAMVEFVPDPLETLVVLDEYLDVEIAGRSTSLPRPAPP
jgi:hypothetical protein